MTDLAALAKTIVHEEYSYGKDKPSYEPIYWDQGFSDTNEAAMSGFIAGDDSWYEEADKVLSEWAADSTYEDARRLTDEYVAKHEDADIDEDDLRDEIRYALEAATTQDYYREWIENMRAPLVRVMLTDEDHPDTWVENDADWTPERLATNAGIEHTDKNLKACQVILDNAYYPGTVKMLFIVFRLDMSDVKQDADTVHIEGEVELWATNPFTGDGMADTVDVNLTIERSRLATDAEACGYSYDTVFGPHWPSIPQPKLTFTKSPGQV
jgi:hypothetical protein